MAKRTARAADPRPSRDDGRKQFLTYMRTDLIKAVKMEALNQERNAYEIVEDAVEDYFRRTQKRQLAV